MILLEDVLIAARTVWGEARGEPYEGQKAVMHVLLNRWRKGGNDHSVAAAALRRWQFSTWNMNDPNRAHVEALTINDARFRTALRAVLEAIDEGDFTRGSTHYHAESVQPYWAQDKQPVVKIGNHLFYNDIE